MRYTNAKVNNTWEPPFIFKREDGTSDIAVPPHASNPHHLLRRLETNIYRFGGLEEDEIIPKEWLERMDHYQHKLTADIKWDVGDVLVIDVSKRKHKATELNLQTTTVFLSHLTN